MNAMQARALALAAGEVGVREAGKNRGIRVELYQRAAGGVPGESYCADFVVWAFSEACREMGEAMPIPVSRSALGLWRRSNLWTHWHQPTPGAIFVHDHGGGLGHCGLVEDVRADGGMLTIEGNTGPGPGAAAADREGDGVYRRHDRRADDPRLVGFVDVSRARL